MVTEAPSGRLSGHMHESSSASSTSESKEGAGLRARRAIAAAEPGPARALSSDSSLDDLEAGRGVSNRRVSPVGSTPHQAGGASASSSGNPTHNLSAMSQNQDLWAQAWDQASTPGGSSNAGSHTGNDFAERADALGQPQSSDEDFDMSSFDSKDSPTGNYRDFFETGNPRPITSATDGLADKWAAAWDQASTPGGSSHTSSRASSHTGNYPADIETGNPRPATGATNALGRSLSPGGSPSNARSHTVNNSDGIGIHYHPRPATGAAAGASVEQQPGISKAHALFSASLTQAVATALSFGLKPFVEAAVEAAVQEILKAGGWEVDLGGQELSKIVSNVVGGAFIGCIHSAVGASVGAYMAGATGGEVYKDQNPSHSRREFNDAIAVSAPVIAFFTATYAAGPAAMAKAPASIQNNPGVAAAVKAAQSIAAGAVQGAVTAAVKQMNSDFKASPAEKITVVEVASKFRENFKKSFNPENPALFGKQGIGKVAGSILGMAATTWAGPAGAVSAHGSTEGVKSDVLSSAAGGAAGMATYLAGWFGGAHVGSLVGNVYAERSEQPSNVRVAPAAPPSSEDSMV